jgi:hypothetical protein
MTYSDEKSTTQTSWLSERYPAETIGLNVRLSLPGLELPSVSIGMAPLIPNDLHDVLWSRGLCEGVFEAVRRADFSYATSSVHVTFEDLSIPVELTTLTDDELENLGSILSEMVADSLAISFTGMRQVDRPQMSVEAAIDLILFHSDPQDFDAERKGWIDLLNDSYLEAMAHNEAAPPTPWLDRFAAAFQEIMIALSNLLQDYASQQAIDKKLVAALWRISHEGKSLVAANTQIRRGAANQEWLLISHWADTIEYVTGEIVTGANLDIPVLLKIALEEDYAGVARI